jgi:pimeloyl-ACP methyl ester carboxylesterase/lysophospholipase L1-like esterase
MRGRYRNEVLRFAFLTLVLGSSTGLHAQTFPGRASQWHGHARHDFEVDGRKCIIVVPKFRRPGSPWVWRARFFGHQPQADVALLRRGYHVAYCDVAGLFGSPTAVGHWNAFYKLLTERHHLASKPALEGMSRGGLIIYNWAAANPDKVACIYGDAPVCDFKSWPGGHGAGKGSSSAWKKCLAAYGLTDEAALRYDKNPVDNLAPLAEAKIPLLHVIGAADRVVPPAENSTLIAKRYAALGGDIQVIAKRGVGHHPHALKNPRPIVEFVVGRCRAAGADQSSPQQFADNVVLRGHLRNSRRVFDGEKRGHVAFMGGSITEMNGYRPMVCEILRRRYPKTKFTFTAAGISSTCSTTGAFRLAADVLSKGPVDLFFVEFAVNDDQDAAHAKRTCIRGMEGIVRRLRGHNPNADIILVQFINPAMRDTLLRGESPLTIAAHETVAGHYGVSSIHLAREVTDRIVRGEFTWKQFGGTHPKKPGNALTSHMIGALFERGWAGPRIAVAQPHPMPDPIDPGSYGHGGFVAIGTASITNGWKLAVPNWSKLPGGKRRRFTALKMLCADDASAQLTLKFRGTAIGAYVVAGPDAGILEGSIDGEPFTPVDLYHRFSRGLHYPRTVMFAEDLKASEHVLKLRTAKTTKSKGHAARIMQFVVDGTPR